MILPNGTINWDKFDTEGYVSDNYETLHDIDRRIIAELMQFYCNLPRVAHFLDVGTGPNLYPLMLAAAASREIEALDYSFANVEYLHRTFQLGPNRTWRPFWELCRELNPELPKNLSEVLRRAHARQGDAFQLPSHRYGLVSMFFVAEVAAGNRDGFNAMMCSVMGAIKPGGYLVAAFMTGMTHYRMRRETLPAFSINKSIVLEVAEPLTEDLWVSELRADPDLPYEYDSVVLITARAK